MMMTSPSTTPTDDTAAGSRVVARLMLALLVASSVAAPITALRIDANTGTQTGDQAVLLLRCAVVGLAAWLLVCVGAGVWNAMTERSETPIAKRSDAPPKVSPTTRISHRVSPFWIRALAHHAFGAAVVVTVLTTNVPGVGAATRHGTVAAAPTRESSAAAATTATTATGARRDALRASGVTDFRQEYRIDPSSGQQWPVVDAQAEAPLTAPPAASATTLKHLPGVARTPLSAVPSTTSPTTRTTPAPSTTPTAATPPTAPPASTPSTQSPISPATNTPAPTNTTAPKNTTAPTNTTATTYTAALQTRSDGRIGPSVPVQPVRPDANRTQHVVHAGESFWTIAESTVFQSNAGADDGDIVRFWRTLIALNAGNLPVPDNPDLLYPGTLLQIPSL